MLRVVGGALRGRVFAMPEKGVRPTANRVREALFNILGQDLTGLRVLDLFAGSGALGIESLSRGAVQGCFVEKNPRNARVIKSNLQSLGVLDKSELRIADALQVVQKPWPQGFDFIFADPPYAELPDASFWFALLQKMLRPGGRLIVEHASRDTIGLDSFAETDTDFSVAAQQRRYGDSSLTIFTKILGSLEHVS